MGTGENQPHPARPCRPQTRGSDPASVDVREKIPDERRDAEGNSGLRVSSEVIDSPRELLVYAARCGVPKILLARMAMNILVNEVVGIIPGLGDAFSFWFKSNVRNYELLRRYAAAPERSRRGDWIFLLAVLTLLFIIACVGLFVSLLVLQAIWQLIFGR